MSLNKPEQYMKYITFILFWSAVATAVGVNLC